MKNPTEDLIARGRDVNKKIREQANKLRSKWRKVVTGDEKKRIRDHIRETEEQPKYIKLFDKIQFTLGVLNICACQFFLLNRPEFFWLWYAGVVPVMMFSRFYHFRCLGFQYFMIDFCYFSVFLSLVNLFFIQNSALFFKVCFIFANGPLPVAILIWRNSFIMHDFDKIVSVYVHLLPSMLYYTLRWHTVWQRNVDSDSFGASTVACYNATCEPLTLYDYLIATLFYLTWQILYMLKTEWLDKKKLDSHPELITSLRWMSSDTKNALARSILKSLRKIRLFGKQEEFNSDSMKTKGVFVMSQLLITVAAFLPTPLFYHSSMCHLVFIAFIFTMSIYNGASFYIEVFSKRYNQKIAKIEEMRKFAREAAVVMDEIAAIKRSNSQVLSMEEPVKNCDDDRVTAVEGDAKNGHEKAEKSKGAAQSVGEDVNVSKCCVHPSNDSLDSISRGLQQTSDEALAALQEHANDLHYLVTGGDHNPLTGTGSSYNYAGYPLADKAAARSVSIDSEWEFRDSVGDDSSRNNSMESVGENGETLLELLSREVANAASKSDSGKVTSTTEGVSHCGIAEERQHTRSRSVSEAIPIDE